MPTKNDATNYGIEYLIDRIKTEKGFAVKMLAKLIIKNCDPAKLEKAVANWKSKPPIKPAQVPKTKKPDNGKAELGEWEDFE